MTIIIIICLFLLQYGQPGPLWSGSTLPTRNLLNTSLCGAQRRPRYSMRTLEGCLDSHEFSASLWATFIPLGLYRQRERSGV